MKSLLVLLIVFGSIVGTWFFTANKDSDSRSSINESQGIIRERERPKPQSATQKTPVNSSPTTSWLIATRNNLKLALDNSNFELALRIFDRAYDQASSAEVDILKAQILTHAAIESGNAKPEAVILLLEPYLEIYTDLDAWRMLTSALAETEQLAPLLEALKSSNRLETDGDRYQENLRAMVYVASNLSTEFLRNNNPIATLNLYQHLYEEYPQYPRFQLELARAHLALGSEEQAIPLLQALIYDPDYGTIARQQLELLAQNVAAEEQRLRRQERNEISESDQIVVPLIRAGTSFLIDARIEGVNSRLLLDTGASVTALSIAQIEGLGLEPTGQSIELNTANGTTSSRLFLAKSLAISGLVFQNLVVAEIDLGGSQIDGLLGTDVLRQMGDQYSYIIDDRTTSLIFQPH